MTLQLMTVSRLLTSQAMWSTQTTIPPQTVGNHDSLPATCNPKNYTVSRKLSAVSFFCDFKKFRLISPQFLHINPVTATPTLHYSFHVFERYCRLSVYCIAHVCKHSHLYVHVPRLLLVRVRSIFKTMMMSS